MSKLNLFLSLSLIVSGCFACDTKSLDIKLKKIRATVTQPLDAALKKKVSILKQEGSLLKEGKNWKKVNQLLTELKNTPEYQFLHKIQEALNLLNALEDLVFSQPHSELLKSVSSLLQSSTSLSQPCKSFFQKERAQLMDRADESILFKTKQFTVSELRSSLLKELKTGLKNLKNVELYSKLKTAHETYLNDKGTKKAKLLITKITHLEQEKTIQLLNNQNYLTIQNEKDLLLEQTRTPKIQKRLIEASNSLLSSQLSLFIAPLDLLIL